MSNLENWTKEKPTEGGCYLFREQGKTEVFVIFISEDGEERVDFINGRREYLANLRGEFSGPVVNCDSRLLQKLSVATKPKSREEWVFALDKIIAENTFGGYDFCKESKDLLVNDIMALQSDKQKVEAENFLLKRKLEIVLDEYSKNKVELERIRLKENELVCAVDLGIQQLQQIQHTEGMVREDVEIIEKMKKAREAI